MKRYNHYPDTMKKAMTLLNAYDEDTKNHCRRVGVYTYIFVRYLFENRDSLTESYKLDNESIKDIVYAAYVHDIGKITVPVDIIRKTEKLDRSEWEQIKTHPLAGANFFACPGCEIITEGIRDHQEKFNGSGYPNGLVGKDISLAGRIIGMMDAFDVMTEHRCYDPRKSKDLEEALIEIVSCMDTHFDEELAMFFVQMCYKYNILAIKEYPEVFDEYCSVIMQWVTEERQPRGLVDDITANDGVDKATFKLLRQISVDKNK